MSNKKDQSSKTVDSTLIGNKDKRRKVLKSIVAGGGIVTAASTTDKWTEPVIKSLVLPAHAQTSDVSDTDASATTMAPTTMAPTTTADPTGNFTSVMSVSLNGSFDESQNAFAKDESISEELLEFFLPSANAVSCGMDCDVQINATVRTSEASFCTTAGQVVDQSPPYYSAYANVDTTSNPPMLTESFNLGNISINSGSFDVTTGEWTLNGFDGQNASTSIVLTPGGDGCIAVD